MTVAEFIVSKKTVGGWKIILKDQKRVLADIDLGETGARQEHKGILDQNPPQYGRETSFVRIDFRDKDLIKISQGISKYIYEINPTLYRKIIEYVRSLPIGGVVEGRYSYSDSTYINHLIPVHLDSDNIAAAAAIGESIGGPNIGSRVRSFLNMGKVSARNLEPWRTQIAATRRREQNAAAATAIATAAPGKRREREESNNNTESNNNAESNLENKYKPRSRMAKGGRRTRRART